MNDTIIIAADELSLQDCIDLTEKIGDRVYAIKVHGAYDEFGPDVVGKLKSAGATRVWMDAKLHDIPNTARFRAEAFAKAGVDIITVHASGGVEMMRAACEGAPNAEIYAVTVLTSLAEEDVQAIYGKSVEEAVRELAHMAKRAGVAGVVCSPKEVTMLAGDPELTGLKFVVPGVRSEGKDAHDQKRVATPKEAVDAGATHLVIGRQVVTAADPVAALEEIEAELSV